MATLNASPNAYAQQNGGPATSAYVRPQFRRQGSSYGPGHVHNMAVMVAPNRVDYSVTKGGLRLWAVLFVFIFLCSALLTIFSEESGENLENRSDITPDIEEAIESGDAEEAEPPPPAPPDIDEDEDDRDEEEVLLASLKEKAAKRRREKEKVKKSEEKILEDVPREKKRRERKKAREQEEEKIIEKQVEEKEEESEHEVPEEEEEIEVKEIPRKGRRKVQVKVDQIEVETEEPVKRKQKKRKDVKEAKIEEDKEEEEHEEEIEQPETLLKEEIEEEYTPTENQPQRQPRKQKRTAPKSRPITPRPNIEDDKVPRKNLLKNQKRKSTKPIEPESEEDDDEENEADEDDDEKETSNKEEPIVQVREVVSVRKKTGHYNRKAFTNREDYKHRNKLDLADYLVEKHEFDTALKTYDQVLDSYRDSPRARFGRARVFQLRSEFEQEDHFLDQALAEYQLVLENDDTPEMLFRQAADNLIESARFCGNLHKVMTVQRLLIDKFPDDISLQTEFGLTFLMMGRSDDARKVFENVLELDPNNALSLAYYGYILKVHYKETEKGVMAMRRGLRMSSTEINDPKFYYHLGDGLLRIGKSQEAYKIYEEAASLNLFPSMYQRSTYNLEGLIARPWWTMEQSGCGRFLKSLERQWTIIREEALELWNNRQILFEPEDSHLTDGLQRALYFMKDTEFNRKNCALAPNTCNILKKFTANANCDKGEIKFSVIKVGSRIWPHCGPSNFILEANLGLVVPSEGRIRVGKESRGWKTGRFIIFDKSFEHEIWFDGAISNNYRIVLSIDLWHPEVPASSRTETHFD